jgi:hypothetical protein
MHIFLKMHKAQIIRNESLQFILGPSTIGISWPCNLNNYACLKNFWTSKCFKFYIQ